MVVLGWEWMPVSGDIFLSTNSTAVKARVRSRCTWHVERIKCASIVVFQDLRILVLCHVFNLSVDNRRRAYKIRN